MKIVGRALLKEKHPQQSDHEKEARREPKHSVNDRQPSRNRQRQVLADEHKFDGKRRNQSERRDVMEKGKEGRHRVFLPLTI